MPSWRGMIPRMLPAHLAPRGKVVHPRLKKSGAFWPVYCNKYAAIEQGLTPLDDMASLCYKVYRKKLRQGSNELDPFPLVVHKHCQAGLPLFEPCLMKEGVHDIRAISTKNSSRYGYSQYRAT